MQASAIGELITAVLLIFIFLLCRRLGKKYLASQEAAIDSAGKGDGIKIFMLGCLVFFGIVCGVVGVIKLCDYWTLIALFNPELALAHKVLGL